MPIDGEIALYEAILKELRNGKMRFTAKDESVTLNPLSVVPKKDGSWRPILNLSHPKDNSVNSHTDHQFKT